MNKRFLATGLLLSVALSTMAGCGKQNSVDTNSEAADLISEAPEWAQASAIYEVNIRQYTEEGTFDAFAEHLDEIKAMGIDIIWLMPVHPISETKRSGTLGSYYSITDYREINPEFGTKEDFAELVDAAHERGMYVMMDWVANHTGWDCAWIEEHPDWYTQVDGEIISPENMGWPDVADLNFDNADMREEMIDCMAGWVRDYDIDGFRCDYATGVPTDFWEQARAELEKIKPVYMLAEDGNTDSLLEYAFDENYNWSLYDNMVQVAKGSKNADKLKLYVCDNEPEGTYSLNFLDNHDKNSYEGTIVENFGSEALPAFWTYIFTIPGQPLVYSGDEIGYDHAIAFMEKDPIAWDAQTADYRELIATLSEIRKEHQALYAGNSGGEMETLETGSSSVIAFSRSTENDQVIVVINLSKNEQTVDGLNLPENAKVLLHADATGITAKDEMEATMAPWECYVFSTDN